MHLCDKYQGVGNHDGPPDDSVRVERRRQPSGCRPAADHGSILPSAAIPLPAGPADPEALTAAILGRLRAEGLLRRRSTDAGRIGTPPP